MVSGGQVTVTSDSWDADIEAGGAVTVGFVTSSSGGAGQPADCTINGVSCGTGTPSPAASATAAPAPPRHRHPQRRHPSTPASRAAGIAGLAPSVDTSLFPPFSLVDDRTSDRG